MNHYLRQPPASLPPPLSLNPLHLTERPLDLERLDTDLTQRLERLAIRIKQRLDPLPLCDERLVLVQQPVKQLGLVQARHEPVLHVLTRVIDEEVHDGLGDEVLNALSDNAKVRRDQPAEERRLHFFPLRQRPCRVDRHLVTYKTHNQTPVSNLRTP